MFGWAQGLVGPFACHDAWMHVAISSLRREQHQPDSEVHMAPGTWHGFWIKKNERLCRLPCSHLTFIAL